MSERSTKKKPRAPRAIIEDLVEQSGISVSVRFPNLMIQRAEKLADRMGQPGISVSRSGILRVALLRGLDALDADRKKGRKRPRYPATPGDGQLQTAVRLSSEIVQRIDVLADRISQPGLTVSRSEALRYAILRGLEALEKGHRT
jgi:hypothetical protein